MSYVVFARRWRPQTFAEVIGQEHVTVTLENAIKSNRIASAYLFSGPRGVGKTTSARILAKALNCEQGPTTTPCNTCSACEEIARGNSIDVLEIDGASNRGIDEVRNLRESTRYTPARQKHKIYIVDEVHMLTTEAFNALLKTLEEPPPHVIFIFATTEIHKVPPTILSRCQRFDFRRISMDSIVTQLEAICQHEKIEIEPGALQFIAKKADGSMRDGESILDQIVAYSGDSITESDVASLLGLVRYDLFFALTDAIAARDIQKVIEHAHTTYQSGVDVGTLLNGLIEHFHHVLLLKTNAATAQSLGLEQYQKEYQRLAQAFGELDLIRMIKHLTEAAIELKRAANQQLGLEVLLVQLAKMSPSVELQHVIDGLDALKKKAAPSVETGQTTLSVIPEIDPSRVSRSLFNRLSLTRNATVEAEMRQEQETTESPQADDTAALDIDEIRKAWPKIVNSVKSERITIGSFLEEGEPAMLKEDFLEIVFHNGNGFHVKSINEHRVFIQEKIAAILGKRVRIRCSNQVEHAAAAVATAPEEPPLVDPFELEQPQPQSLPKQSTPPLSGNTAVKMLIESLDGEPIA